MAENERQALYRNIPSVDRLLLMPEIKASSSVHPRALVLAAIHETLDQVRKEIKSGTVSEVAELTPERVSARVLARLARIARPSLRSVINGTGVVVHTNLGRSILPEPALQRFRSIAGGYSNLEYNLDEGRRGSRYVHVEGILRELTGAEAAMVVNNNAGAVLIALETVARGREVIVSRGQLVEIGGSFRIPDVMRKSGGIMVEVGTTNRTRLKDYEEVIGPNTGLLLKVHTSNFHVVGFTEEVPLSELVKLGARYGIPVMEDLGSGCFLDFGRYGLLKEPTVQEVVGQGADVVTFSGDKLLGGPQAGIILGKKGLVEAIRKNPLNRALRIDKLTLLALEETLRLYRDEEAAVREIPTLRMILQPYPELRKKATRLLRMIGPLADGNFTVCIEDGTSKVGGGALPLLEIPSRLLCLLPGKMSAAATEAWFRSHEPPIIGRVERERFLLDVRTIQENELKTVAAAVRALASEDRPSH